MTCARCFSTLSILLYVFLAAGCRSESPPQGEQSVRANPLPASGMKKATETELPNAGESIAAIPKLIDYGATTCTPCKMMAPILDELQREYAGKVEVSFVDVSINQEAGRQARLRVIPTQVFIAADGRELFRHEGFYAKNAIIAKWRELGFEID